MEDRYFGSGKHLKHAKEKYGLENFEFKILIDLKSKDEMNLLEKMVVTEEFCKRKDTYNINVGGEGEWNYINSHELNIGFRYANEHGLNNSGRKGKKQSAYQVARIKAAIKLDRELHPEKYDRRGEKAPSYGKHRYRNKITGERKFLKEEEVPDTTIWCRGWKIPKQ